MIAHRLQTIRTAENLLYIDNPKKILAAEKGTSDYDSIMQKLKSETYKHQQDIGEDTAKKLAEDGSEAGIPEERPLNPEREEGNAINMSFKMEKKISIQ